MSFNRELYEAIRRDAEPKIIEVEGRKYSSAAIHPVKEPTPAPLVIHTLTGLVDYLNSNVDQLDQEHILVLVSSPTTVKVMSGLSPDFFTRAQLIEVEAELPRHHFDEQMRSEDFNIWLQSGFCDSGDRSKVLLYASHTVSSAEAGVVDNGVSQAVTVRTGITSKALKELPNPVQLAPYRTFVEVSQPASSFVFRVHEGSRFSLWEGDGGAWRNEAIGNIAKWLADAFVKRNLSVTIIA